MGNFKQNAYLILKSRKTEAELKAWLVNREVLSDSEYAAINAECVKLGFQIARLGAQKQDTSNLNIALTEKKRLRNERLKELGHTEDELVPHYFCPTCNDTGIVNGKECACLKELVYEELRNGTPGVPTDIDSFSPDLTNKLPDELKANYAKLYSLLSRYAKDFPENKAKIIGICGPVGCGKSFAAGVFANVIMRKGYSVLFLSAIQLNNIFLRYHTAPLSEKEGIFSPLIDADLIVIDDLGAETSLNNVTINYLYALLSERKDKHILITSNLDYERLRDRYGDRVASRLTDASRAWFCKMEGSDLRKMKM